MGYSAVDFQGSKSLPESSLDLGFTDHRTCSCPYEYPLMSTILVWPCWYILKLFVQLQNICLVLQRDWLDIRKILVVVHHGDAAMIIIIFALIRVIVSLIARD